MLSQSKIWSVARRGQKRQAEKMLSDTAKHLPLVSIGDNVRVTIPKVDRGKLGDKHILGVITEKSGISFTIGTKDGILNRKSSTLYIVDSPHHISWRGVLARHATR